jgi:hypothetical protein
MIKFIHLLKEIISESQEVGKQGSALMVGINYDKSSPVDIKLIPKSIKDWVASNNNNKRGKYYIIDGNRKLKFDDMLNSLTDETSQFFSLSLDKNGKLSPKPIGKLSVRSGYDPDYSTSGGSIIQGEFTVPAGKILVASKLWLGKYLDTYIYTGGNSFNDIMDTDLDTIDDTKNKELGL